MATQIVSSKKLARRKEAPRKPGPQPGPEQICPTAAENPLGTIPADPGEQFFPADLVRYLEQCSPKLLDSFILRRFGDRANLRRRVSDLIMEMLTCECQILLASHCASQKSRTAPQHRGKLTAGRRKVKP